MKLLASAVALIMVGLTGMWLWFDATADARQDLPGVVVAVDDLPADPGVAQPGDEGAAAGSQADADVSAGQDREQADRDAVTTRMLTVDTLLSTLRAARGDLAALSDDIVAEAEKAETETAETEKAEAEKKAKAAAGDSGSSGSSSSSGTSGGGGGDIPPAAPAPQPVSPAPATPPGMCWDDGELEECDDDWDDDEWDDDEWDD